MVRLFAFPCGMRGCDTERQDAAASGILAGAQAAADEVRFVADVLGLYSIVAPLLYC